MSENNCNLRRPTPYKLSILAPVHCQMELISPQSQISNKIKSFHSSKYCMHCAWGYIKYKHDHYIRFKLLTLMILSMWTTASFLLSQLSEFNDFNCTQECLKKEVSDRRLKVSNCNCLFWDQKNRSKAYFYRPKLQLRRRNPEKHFMNSLSGSMKAP